MAPQEAAHHDHISHQVSRLCKAPGQSGLAASDGKSQCDPSKAHYDLTITYIYIYIYLVKVEHWGRFFVLGQKVCVTFPGCVLPSYWVRFLTYYDMAPQEAAHHDHISQEVSRLRKAPGQSGLAARDGKSQCDPSKARYDLTITYIYIYIYILKGHPPLQFD